jgi:hypothetical protein
VGLPLRKKVIDFLGTAFPVPAKTKQKDKRDATDTQA